MLTARRTVKAWGGSCSVDVDQHVHAAVALDDAADDVGDGRHVGHVGGQAERITAGGADRRDRAVHTSFGRITAGGAPPSWASRAAARSAGAARGAGDDGYPSVESQPCGPLSLV